MERVTTQDDLKPLATIYEIYKGVLIPQEKMVKYFPTSRVQIWKASQREYLVIDTHTWNALLVCNYWIAAQIRAELILYSNLV